MKTTRHLILNEATVPPIEELPINGTNAENTPGGLTNSGSGTLTLGSGTLGGSVTVESLVGPGTVAISNPGFLLPSVDGPPLTFGSSGSIVIDGQTP